MSNDDLAATLVTFLKAEIKEHQEELENHGDDLDGLGIDYCRGRIDALEHTLSKLPTLSGGERPRLYLDVSYSDGAYEIVDQSGDIDLIVNDIDESRREGDGTKPCLRCALDHASGHLMQLETILLQFAHDVGSAGTLTVVQSVAAIAKTIHEATPTEAHADHQEPAAGCGT